MRRYEKEIKNEKLQLMELQEGRDKEEDVSCNLIHFSEGYGRCFKKNETKIWT